jgi:hypothetical protein
MPTGIAQDLTNQRNMRVGVVDVYWAVEDTLYGAVAPAWTYLGVADPGSVIPDFPRSIFSFKAGFPRATKFQAVIGTEGKINLNLVEHWPLAVELAAGSGPQTRTYATVPAPTTVASAPTVTGCTLTSGTGYAVGQLCEIALPGGITDLVTLLTVSGAAVTWAPATRIAPIATAVFQAVKTVKQGLGSNVIVRGALKAVFTDENGETITIHIPACTPVGTYKPNFADATKNVVLPLEFDAYGKQQTWNGTSQTICAFVYHDTNNVT